MNNDRKYYFFQRRARFRIYKSNFMNLEAYPKPGQRVRFELKASAKGEEAVDIQVI